MNTTHKLDLISAKLEGDELISTPIGDIELVDNYFNDDASNRLFDEMDYQRAGFAFQWGDPGQYRAKGATRHPCAR
jgi:hypothetical protein